MRPVFVAVALACSGSGAILLPGSVSAAPPAYCALYAREYAAAKIVAPATNDDVAALARVQNQAYFRCLNRDEEPAFPETSAYFGASIGDIAGDTSGGIGEGDVSGDDEPVDAPPASPPPARTAATAPASSGLKPWSPEWIAWCKQHYHSFNAKTGMVTTFSGVTRLCP